MRGIGGTITKRIHEGEFTSIWIVNQRRPHNEVPMSQIRRFVSEMGLWIRKAKASGIHVYVLGITGSHWNEAQWTTMIADKLLYDRKRRFCALNIKVDPYAEKPSNVCLRVLSFTPINSTPCNCKIAFKDHVSDWNHKGESHTHRLRNERFARICCSLLDRGAFSEAFHAAPLGLIYPNQRSTPDPRSNHAKDTQIGEQITTTHAYPTDERIEWKKRRK